MGFKVFNDSLNKIPVHNKSLIINTISPNSYGISTKDSIFKNALKNSDFLVLDGVYFGLAYFLRTGKFLKKNQGPFLANYFLKYANKNSYKVFFLGSSKNTLLKIKVKINSYYPNINFESYSPPFKKIFSEEDSNQMIDKVNKFQPNFLFIGMTCPKQEKWSYIHKSKLKTNLILNVGAVFDWIAGNEKEISSIWWKLRLAWLKRTFDRPQLLLRYPDIFLFFRDLILVLLKIKKI